MDKKLLDIRNLRVELKQPRGKGLPVLDGIDLSISRGETVGIVGESGCGKSVLSLSMLGLLPNALHLAGGEVEYDGQYRLDRMNNAELRRFRGKEVSMIFQDPMSSLNNGLTIGMQVMETIRLHLRLSRREAAERTVELFRKVGLPRPEALLKEYPHQLSGGMRQRVMIAIAIACNPGLLIADEPTTALDVTIQAQILDLLRRIREEQNTSILLISHDLGVILSMCDRIAVMYAGRIVEQGRTADIFNHPSHPYTIGLLNAMPTPSKKQSKLYSIPGSVPSLQERGRGCRFASRCSHVMEQCLTAEPLLLSVQDKHEVRCFWASKEGENASAAVV